MVITYSVPARESCSGAARYEPVRPGYRCAVRGRFIIGPAVGGASIAVGASVAARAVAFHLSDRDCRSGASRNEVSDSCHSASR